MHHIHVQLKILTYNQSMWCMLTVSKFKQKLLRLESNVNQLRMLFFQCAVSIYIVSNNLLCPWNVDFMLECLQCFTRCGCRISRAQASHVERWEFESRLSRTDDLQY